LGSGEYTLLASEFLHDEIARKLIELRFDEERIIERLALLRATAEWIEIPEEAVEPATSDPDDDHIVACAVTGGADYLVTYNRRHYGPLGEVYRGVQIITQPWVFLNILRDAAAPKVDNPQAQR
jgi:predicted nucleic acid-binding protein